MKWQLESLCTSFDGPRYPLGALVFYKAKGGELSEVNTKPGLFAEWHTSPGVKYKGSLLVLDYQSLRNRSHWYWVPKQIQAKECILPYDIGIVFIPS